MKPFTVFGLMLATALLTAAVMTSRPRTTQQSAARPLAPQAEPPRVRTFHPPPRFTAEAESDPAAPTTRRSLVVGRLTRRTAGGDAATQFPTTPLPTGQPRTDDDDDMPDEEPEPVVPIEVARAAVGLVGQDPDAEDAWAQAINDPALSAKQRRDLIEDLNEDGFADPRNLTPDDVPLILSRLALIERLGPEAMDDVNADAFVEAYKDLNNMLARLERQMQQEQDLQTSSPTPESIITQDRLTRRVSARR